MWIAGLLCAEYDKTSIMYLETSAPYLKFIISLTQRAETVFQVANFISELLLHRFSFIYQRLFLILPLQ